MELTGGGNNLVTPPPNFRRKKLPFLFSSFLSNVCFCLFLYISDNVFSYIERTSLPPVTYQYHAYWITQVSKTWSYIMKEFQEENTWKCIPHKMNAKIKRVRIPHFYFISYSRDRYLICSRSKYRYFFTQKKFKRKLRVFKRIPEKNAEKYVRVSMINSSWNVMEFLKCRQM